MAAVFANNDQRLVDYSDNRETTPLVPVTGNSVASSPAPSPAPPSAIPVFLPTILFLTAASMAGVLARHGLRVITGPDGAKMAKDEDPLFPDVWSNMIGSFLMGIVGVVLKRDLTQWYGPLQVALGTGFCGSLTTFSAWNHQTVRMFDTRRPGAAIMCIIVGLALPYASLALGVGAGHAMAPTVQALLARFPCRTALRRAMYVIAALSIAACVALAAVTFDFRRRQKHFEGGRDLWMSVVVGPTGTILRWRLAALNTKTLSRVSCCSRATLLNGVPWGTLIANIVASILFECFVWTERQVNTGSWVFHSLHFGFTGCLSTVSSFIAEIYNQSQDGAQPRSLPLLYVLLSLVPSVGLGVLVAHFI